MSRLVYGVGINDLRYLEKNKGTKEYALWCDMLKRCYEEKYLERFPTYKGCKVSDEWLIFSNFRRDINFMKNFDKVTQGWVLDKDLCSDTKTYSKDTCCFIPDRLNLFLSNLTKEYRATYDKRWNIYYAYCVNIHGKKVYLGRYKTIKESKKVYLQFKAEVFQEIIDLYKDDLDDRTLYHLRKIRSDYCEV